MSEKCYKCGREYDSDSWGTDGKCFAVDGPSCLMTQIANLTAENIRLKHDLELLRDEHDTTSASLFHRQLEVENLTEDLTTANAATDNLARKLTATEAERDRLKALLAKYQWANGGSYCPSCGQYFSNGHLPNCDLAEALK